MKKITSIDLYLRLLGKITPSIKVIKVARNRYQNIST